MTDRYENIRKALEMGPTPGPWYHGAKNGEHKYCVYDKVCWTDEYGRHGDTPNMVVHVSPDDGKFREAAYIAAADPSTIRALLAERDELAKDATRYRWLRNMEDEPPMGHPYVGKDTGSLAANGLVSGQELDAAIDAAMQARKQGGE